MLSIRLVIMFSDLLLLVIFIILVFPVRVVWARLFRLVFGLNWRYLTFSVAVTLTRLRRPVPLLLDWGPTSRIGPRVVLIGTFGGLTRVWEC